VIRYHLFGGVSWSHFPLYVLNKVFALSGFVLLVLSSIISRYNHARLFRSLDVDKDMLGFSSLVLIIIHVFISLILLGPEYYDKFFQLDGKMNFLGELSMLFGVLGLGLMWMVNRFFSISGSIKGSYNSRRKFRRMIILAIIAGFIHTVFMGIKSWFSPSGWHGYLPPITLLATVVFIYWGWVVLFKRRKTN
jgi:hypothetical protein